MSPGRPGGCPRGAREGAGSLHGRAGLVREQGSYAEAGSLYEQGLRGTLNHLSLNMPSMTEKERFQYLVTKKGSEHLLLNLVSMQGEGPSED